MGECHIQIVYNRDLRQLVYNVVCNRDLRQLSTTEIQGRRELSIPGMHLSVGECNPNVTTKIKGGEFQGRNNCNLRITWEGFKTVLS